MTESIYHTTNYIPLLGFFISIILISGFYLLGKVTIQYFGLKKLIKDVSETKYQNILIGVNLIILLMFPIVLWKQNTSNEILIVLTYLIFFLGLFNLVKLYKKYKIRKFNLKIKKLNYFELLVYLSIAFYFMISSAPVTNADSLDYHLHIGKNIAQLGTIPLSLNHFHSHLFGNGEIIIAIGIIAGTEQLNSIIQFCGLISIMGVIKHKNKYKINFYIYLLSAPIIIFFLSSIKPQFFFIASTSLVFSLLVHTNYKNEYLNLKKYLFSFILLSIASQAKFSFMLSLGILSFYCVYDSYKTKTLLKTLLSFIVIFSLLNFSTIIWKSIFYNTSIFNLFTSPFPTEDLGMNRFKSYLVNAGKGGNILNGIVFPDGLKNLTNSIGLAFFLILILFKNLKKNIEPVVIIIFFIITALIIGQPSSRFLFEPFVWSLISLSKSNMFNSIGKTYDKILKLQFLIFFPAIIYGGITLFPGILSDGLKNKIMENNSNGYNFFKWSNQEIEKLNYKGPIITFHRSVSLLKGNKFISKDFVYFTDIDKEDYFNYLQEIKILNPKYIITTSYDEEITKKYFSKCDMELISKKENVDKHTSRKPFSNGSFYDGLIFKINSSKLPSCVLIKK